MTTTVLMDLGNVVIGVDFKRVFRYWSMAADVSEDVFYARWSLDEAYKLHEVGQLDFAQYAAHLSALFEVDLPLHIWQAGWNDIWTEPFQQVVTLLPEVRERYQLFAFTNTNATHAAHWRVNQGHALTDFEHIFVSSEIGLRKPDRDAFEFVCDYMSAPASDVVFIDDTRENIEGANAAGLNGVLARGENEVVSALADLLKPR